MCRIFIKIFGGNFARLLIFRSELAEKEEGKEEEAEKRKKKLEEKAARKRELMLKSLME